MNLGNVIRFWSTWNPDGEAVVIDGEAVTWAALHQSTSRLANGLRARGVGPGDRVGVLSGNRLEYLELAIAGYKLGSVLVPLNVRLTAPELAFILDDAGCSVVVAAGDLADLGSAAIDRADTVIDPIGLDPGFGTHVDDVRHADPTDPAADVDADDLVYILYTSGTTGAPKGAMMSHANVLAMSYNRILADDLTSSSRVYLPFPLSFTGGLVSMWAPTYVGGATLVLDPAVDPTRALQVMQDQAITNFSAVPVIWEMIVQHPQFADYDLSALTVIGSGGAAVPEALLLRLQEAGLPMSQGYGSPKAPG